MSQLAEPRIERSVAERAAQWWVDLQDEGAGARQREAWQRWLAADPAHAQAWQRIEAVSGQLAGISMPLARASLAGPASVRRRQAIRLLSVVAMGGGAALAVRQTGAWHGWMADVSTTVGERRRLALADGSTVVLNTASAVNLRFDAQRRLLQLVYGEIFVQTAPDAQRRPFAVLTGAGLVRALGTRFNVRHQGRGVGVDVGVQRGAVELLPADAPAVTQRLEAGERGRFHRVDAQRLGGLDDNDGAWVDGLLVATRMPLGQFLAEVGRYRRGRIVCDPAVAQLQVSGVYPLSDTDHVLKSLTSSLPVVVQSFSRYWVTVRPAG